MEAALIWEWVIKSLILIFIVLTGFAYTTYLERKELARMQVRIGPNRAGPWGLLQPVADGIKLIFKEELTPAEADRTMFVLSPIITTIPALVLMAVIPWGDTAMLGGREVTLYLADINVGVLYLAAISSIAVYGIVLAGWSSNNKYATLGGLRSSAQMISYELAMGLMFVVVILMANSMSLLDIVKAQEGLWFAFLQPVGAVVLFITLLAEVNRAPFDMPEAEQELVAGYHTEYSGMKFALFFMAEYGKMIVVSAVLATMFFGGYLGPGVKAIPWLGPLYLGIKIFISLFVMIWIRATFPRIRYDRLMAFGWKVLLPLSLALVFITALGILLEMKWLIPVLSLGAGWVATSMVNRALRRKEYAR